MDNRVFVGEAAGEDLDRIDIITSESVSTHSEPHSPLGSRDNLTSRHTNFRFTSESPNPNSQECIELATNGDLLRRRSSHLNATNSSNMRAPTPTNMVRRWSQSISRFSKDKRSIREKTIYRLPSRRMYETDGKLLIADPNAELEQLVNEIEQHDYLMQDTALSKQSRLETLRALPQPLSTKRLLKTQLCIDIEHQQAESRKGNKRLYQRVLNVIMTGLLKTWYFLCLIYDAMEIWYDSLKTIEGHFGSNVSSYFKFLRWLFAFNVMLFLLPLSFIMLPQILYNDDVNWRNLRENKTEILALVQYNIDAITDESAAEFNETISSKNDAWSFEDILAGEGKLKTSLMFYGSYSNVTFNYGNSHASYSIPHAYYMTMLLMYLFIFVVISTSMARSYRKSFIEISGGLRNLYALKIFCAWDYGISNRKAAELKHFMIYNELKEVLSELGVPKVKLSVWWRIWIFCSQLIAHLLVCAMIAGLGVAIWLFLKAYSDASSSWHKLFVAFVINLSLLLLQIIFSWISKMEDYRSPRRTLHIKLIRNFLTEFVVIGVLIYFWLSTKSKEGWETSIGQQIYRLVLTDCFITLGIVPLFYCLRVFIVLRFWPEVQRPEFDISLKSLGLVYNQTLLWIGLFFAPLVAGLMLVKMVLLFYMNKAMLLYLCKSPRHMWRSAQTHTFYLVFTFLSLLGVIVALGYIMTQIPISQRSGPFRDYNFMFQIFIDGVLKLRQNKALWALLMMLIRPAVVGGMLIIMTIMVYYLRAKSRAHCQMVKLLKEMLYLETKDKEFLLTSITNITKDREWKLSDTQSDGAVNSDDEKQAEASSTWRYARRHADDSSIRGSSRSMRSSSSAVSIVDECTLRNRNI